MTDQRRSLITKAEGRSTEKEGPTDLAWLNREENIRLREHQETGEENLPQKRDIRNELTKHSKVTMSEFCFEDSNPKNTMEDSYGALHKEDRTA